MPAGRPRIDIDKEEFEKLCGICCTLTEIAGWFKCSEDTIENWCKREYKKKFSECYKAFSSMGKISLRRNQFKMAEKSAVMAIWLGKQHLGQREVVEQTITATSTITQVAEELFNGNAHKETDEGD